MGEVVVRADKYFVKVEVEPRERMPEREKSRR